MKLRIDPDFAAVCPPHSDGEYQQLEKSILKDGVRDPILHWNGIIVDGMTRYAICQKHDLTFTHKVVRFESRQQALAWIASNQIGRRNLTRQQIKYMWGKYISGDANFDLPEGVEKPPERSAREAVVFAKAVDKLTNDVRKKVLSNQSPLTDKEVTELANEGKREQQIKAKIKAVKKPPRKPKPKAKAASKPLKEPVVAVVQAPEPVPLHPVHLNFVAEDRFYKDSIDALNSIVIGVRQRMNDERGRWLSTGLVIEACGRAIAAVEAAAFYAHCPECNGKKGGCDECRCSGWVPKFRYDEIQGLNSDA